MQNCLSNQNQVLKEQLIGKNNKYEPKVSTEAPNP